jgi:hypothetical protein
LYNAGNCPALLRDKHILRNGNRLRDRITIIGKKIFVSAQDDSALEISM